MSFAALPPEIQTHILLLALQPSNAAIQAATLAVVSRECNVIITNFLYLHVRVTTPSALRSLYAAFQAKPALAKLVQSIHIGPDTELPSQGWPLILEEEEGGGSVLGLMPTLDESLLPRWVQPGLAFDIHCPHDIGCKDYAVLHAIRRALEDLDVKAVRRGWSESGRKIGIRAWASRLWLAQAALDLYLIEMRRREELGSYDVQPWDSQNKADLALADLDERCEKGECSHYPALRITKAKASSASGDSESAAASKNQLGLTTEQLWTHLTKPRAPADHFSHLLHLTRCSRLGLKMGNVEWTRLRNDLGGPHWLAFRNEDYRSMMKKEGMPRGEDDVKDDEASVKTFLDESDEEHWDDRGAEEVEALEHGAHRAEDLLQLARGILTSAPQVTNLSLSGWLHRSLDAVQSPEQLRSLSMGPIPRWWQHVLFPLSSGGLEENKRGDNSEDWLDGDSDSGSLESEESRSLESEDSYAKMRLGALSVDGEAKMTSLKRLRICGEMSSRDALKIATQMPALEEVVWELTDQDAFMDEALANVKELQGRQDQAAALAAWGQKAQAQHRGARKAGNCRELARHGTLHEGRQPLAEQYSRQGHPTPREGHRKPQRRCASGSRRQRLDTAATAAAQYAEGKKWWENGREGVGLHSMLCE